MYLVEKTLVECVNSCGGLTVGETYEALITWETVEKDENRASVLITNDAGVSEVFALKPFFKIKEQQ